MIILFLLILIGTNPSNGNHFNGGTITWAPARRNDTSSSILITLTQFYSWTYPTMSCLTDVPFSTNWLLYPAVNLICIGNCSTQGGYSNNPISILTDCTSYSTSLGILTSERSVNVTFNESTYFWIAYQGTSWRTLANAATSFFPGWSIVSLINLQRRPDGFINTPPMSQVTSPQYVIVNRTATIKIPVIDVDIGDDLRCRWSSKTSPYGIDECADICPSTSTISIANLTGCTLTFTATTSNVWYAIALQVEDFINTTSSMPMSSVPIQFLIYVLDTPTCSEQPVILPLIDCLDVQVNVPVNFTLYAMNYCNRTHVIITDIISTISITGLSISSLANSTTNTSLVYVTFTWIPQINQIGSQQFCALAYTSESIQSDPYCVIFTVGTSAPCVTTSTTTISTTSITTTTETTTTTISTTTSTTSITSTTITTMTTTTETTTCTISVTTTTETTTITRNSNPSVLPLIVGLSIFGLLLILVCTGYWLYRLKWSNTAKQRQLNKRGKKLRHDTFTLPITRIQNIGSIQSSKNHPPASKFNNRKSLNSSLFSNSKEARAAPMTDKKRMINDSLVKIKASANSTKEEHQPRSHRSSITVSTGKKPLNTSFYQENELTSTSLTKIHIPKVARNKVSASFETTPNTLVQTSSARSKDGSYTNCTNTTIDDDMRRRASSFNGVTVTRVKTPRNMDRSLTKHSPNVSRSNSDNKQTNNLVRVVSVKKQWF